SRWRRNVASMVAWSSMTGRSGPVAKNLVSALAIDLSLRGAGRSTWGRHRWSGSGSAHGRDGEALLEPGAARGPALGHDLGAGEEAHAVHPVLVEVGEARALPAAETVVGDGHRDRHVDADHAHLDPVGELARGVAVAGEDGHAVPVLVRAGQRERLLEAVRAHDLQHRAEDLVAPGLHLRRDAVEQRGPEEEAVLV